MDHRTRRELHIWMPRAPEIMGIQGRSPQKKSNFPQEIASRKLEKLYVGWIETPCSVTFRLQFTNNHQPPRIPEAHFVGEDSSKLMGSPMSSFTMGTPWLKLDETSDAQMPSNSGEGVGILKEAI